MVPGNLHGLIVDGPNGSGLDWLVSLRVYLLHQESARGVGRRDASGKEEAVRLVLGTVADGEDDVLHKWFRRAVFLFARKRDSNPLLE